MKLSISTLGCPGYTLDEVIALCSACGIYDIEVRGLSGEMLPGEIPEFLPENRLETLSKLKNAGMRFVGFGTSVNFHDESTFESKLDEGRRAIDVCREMNIGMIRVFGNKLPGGCDRKEVTSRVCNGLFALCEYGKTRNVSVCLETHGDFNSVKTLSPIISALGDTENFGIIWDVAHTDRACGDDIDGIYRLLFDYIRHVHIKDHVRHGETPYRLCEVGQGDIPIRKIVKRLLADGYSGDFSLEWEKKWHPELASLDEVLPRYAEFMMSVT